MTFHLCLHFPVFEKRIKPNTKPINKSKPNINIAMHMTKQCSWNSLFTNFYFKVEKIIKKNRVRKTSQ